MTYDAHRKEGEHSREYQTVTDHLTGTAAMPAKESRLSRSARGLKCVQEQVLVVVALVAPLTGREG